MKAFVQRQKKKWYQAWWWVVLILMIVAFLCKRVGVLHIINYLNF